VARRRCRHEFCVLVAPSVPAALASEAPGRPLGLEVARPHLVLGRTPRGIPECVPRADAPRSVADRGLDRVVGRAVAHAGKRYAITAGGPSLPEVAPEFGEYIIEGLNRSVTTRESGIIDPSRIIDLHFAEFMADPFAVIAKIYDAAGFEFTATAEARMRAHLADNPQDKHGKHAYSWEATGLDLGEWREKATRYQEYFDVPSESFA
jgi:hypothetical protein